MPNGGRRIAQSRSSTRYRAGGRATILPLAAVAALLSLPFAWPDPTGLQLAVMMLSVGLVPLGAIVGTCIAAGSGPRKSAGR